MTLESNHSSRRAARPFGALVSLCCVAACLGQTVNFTPMGPLTPPWSVIGRILTVTNDGVVVSTQLSQSLNDYSVCTWRAGVGFKTLAEPAGTLYSVAGQASSDGKYIVGSALRPDITWALIMWIDEGEPIEVVLPGGTGNAKAWGVSLDGSVVGGGIIHPNGDSHGFVFSQKHGLELMPFPPTDKFHDVNQLPELGNVVLSGVIHGQIGGSQEGYRWTREGGVELLGDLPGGGFFSNLSSCNRDGSVGVGRATGPEGLRAARWTQAHKWKDLEVSGQVFSVSGDGWVAVWGDDKGKGYVWNPIDGARWLQDILKDDFGLVLPGWNLGSVVSISENGRYFAGLGLNPWGVVEGFLVEMPAFCYADCDRGTGKGVLDVFDFLCYMSHFDQQDVYSNCNNDGAVDFFDFLCFINKWHEGCP